MDIVVGAIQPPAPRTQKSPTGKSNTVEGRLLHVRPPRSGIAGPSGMERREKKSKDPVRGRILTVLIPDGSVLPQDIDSKEYQVMIRLTPLR